MPRIQVFAGHVDGKSDDKRPPSTKDHGYVALSQVHETLRQIGLEFKIGDYFPERQVIVVIDPDPEISQISPEDQKELARLAHLLETHGTSLRGIGAQVSKVGRS